MAEMSEGVPRVETKAPVVGRVTEKIVNVIKSQMPAEHAKRYYSLWTKVTEPLQGKPKELAEKIDPLVRFASKSLGAATTLFEAQIAVGAVVIPAVVLARYPFKIGEAAKSSIFDRFLKTKLGDGLHSRATTAHIDITKGINSLRQRMSDTKTILGEKATRLTNFLLRRKAPEAPPV